MADYTGYIISPTVAPTVQYLQRVWDDGSGGRWCYYTKSTIDPTPLSTETDPQYTGAISAHSVVAVL